ncbi:DUF6531 domain-containing protein [Streptomyces sp. SPB162]|uniref:DUF6531 domain-containing protein n=1 Tax=Streptomyces sp. SPB162 TaxID=2940560 RepID=UPI002405F626|nr:DUF6531 domain-containing protein [Streptomyces sp. SPB162]MDF9817089.1 RHS repeat-associated protein [Streptomyces sp. SPB162]
MPRAPPNTHCYEASDAGIKNKHWWEKAVDWVADHWDEIVAVCKVIVAVLGIIVMIIGGPLAWIVLAAALVVLADTLIKYAQGKASLWDVLFAAMDCIPGFKGLTTAGGLLKMAKNLPKLMKGMGSHLGGLGNALRKGLGSLRRGGKTMGERVCETDPVDVSTGEMVLEQTDVELPGVLPLLLQRTHVSSYGAGTWFGPSWASTVDQHLEIDGQGVRFAAADGMLLHYPVPEPGRRTTPVVGPRWPLHWDGTPGGVMTVTVPGDTSRFEFRPLDVPAPSSGSVRLPLTAVVDREGNRFDIEHDPAGTPTAIRHHGGYHIGVESHENRITSFRLLSDPDAPTLVRFAYDQAGNLAEVYNSSGLPLRFGYDDQHRLTSWSDRNGTGYGYVYDPGGRVVRTTGTDGFMSGSFAYDDATRTTRFTNSLGHTTTHVHNDAYRTISTTDPLGNVTLQEWDQQNRLLTAVTDPLGRTTRLCYDAADNLTAVVYPNGTSVAFTHNELNLPVRIIDEGGHLWLHEYDDRGNRVASTDPVGARTEYTYDAAGGLTSLTDALGGQHRVTNDAAGLPLAITDPLGATTRCTRDSFGRVDTVVDPLGAATLHTWTLEGRPLTRTLPDGSSEAWAWDGEGNMVSHTDPFGGVTSFESTHFDLTSARTTPDGARVEFSYNTELQLTAVTNAQGLTWTYDYDAAGRMIRELDFHGGALSYTHDAAGQLASRTNGLGQTISYTRDLLGSITEQRSVDGITSLAYDDSGQLVRATNGDAELSYVRDPLGRVLTEACDGRVLTHTYDPLGRRTGRRTPGGSVSTWSWDANSRLESIHSAGRTLRFAHDIAGREIERVLGSTVRLTQKWNESDLVAALTLTGPAPEAASAPSDSLAAGTDTHVLLHRDYTYRRDRHLTAITDRATGTRSFALDRVGRVTGVTGADWTETYAYDPAGNLTHATTPVETDANGPRTLSGGLVESAGRIRYEHDALGRVVLRQKARLSRKPDTWRYTWDSDDRLTTVTTPDGRLWRYLYDPLGRRTAKQRLAPDGTTVQEETRFTWDGTHLVEQTTHVSGSPEVVTLTWERDEMRVLSQTERTTLADAPQDVIDQRFFAIVTDLVGTPTELVTETGDIAWRSHTTLWGIPAGDGDISASTPLRFPGQYFDPESQLHYNYFRHYDPVTAAYVSPDPLGQEAVPQRARLRPQSAGVGGLPRAADLRAERRSAAQEHGSRGNGGRSWPSGGPSRTLQSEPRGQRPSARPVAEVRS